MALTPPLTPPLLDTPSSITAYEKHASDPSSQRSINSKDSAMLSSQTGDFIRLDQLEEGGLSPFSQGSTSISFWYPRRNPQRRGASRQRRRDSGTAIQPGRSMNIFAWKQLGLVFNYGALGFFDGLLPLLAQALYSADSRNRSTVVDVRHLMILLRVVFALVSDTAFSASASRRRRVFLVLGWAIMLLLCTALAALFFVQQTTEPSSLAQYTTIFMLLPIGHVIAGVSADGLMVEYAHREASDERGCIQMLLLATRVVGELVGRSVVSGGGLPTPKSECQGELDCVLPLKITFIVATAVAFIALLSSAFVTRVPSRSRLAMGYAITVSAFPSKLRQTWHFHLYHGYVSFVVFGFLQTTSFAWTSPTSKELAIDWLHMSSTSRLISDGVNRSSQMIAALMMLGLWRNSNWRMTMFVFVVLATLGAELPTAMLILLDKTRSLALLLATHHIAVMCEGLVTLIRVLIAVEMAMPHMEATSFAATTSVFDIGTITGAFAAKAVASMRPVSTDPEAVVWTVAVCLGLYVVRLLVNIAGLSLLPEQKVELHDHRRSASGSKKSWVSSAILMTLAFLLLAAVTINVYALGTGTSGVAWAYSLLFTFL